MQCCAYQDKYEDLKLELEAAKAGVAAGTKDAMEWALKARRAEARLEQFIGLAPIPQNDGVVRFKHSEIEKFKRLESCPPGWNTYAWEAFCDMAIESLDIPKHHAMISTLMKENEKLRALLDEKDKFINTHVCKKS